MKRYEAQKLGLELDLAKNPDNQRAKDSLAETVKCIAWLKERIDSGNDPGMITL